MIPQVLSTVNPAEFGQRSAAEGEDKTVDVKQQSSAWVEEGDTLVDATINLGAGDRRQFRMIGESI